MIKHKLIFILIALLLVGFLFWLDRDKGITFQWNEIAKSFPTSLPIDNPREALEHAKINLAILDQKKDPWIGYVKFMDQTQRKRSASRYYKSCRKQNYFTEQQCLNHVDWFVAADHWYVSFNPVKDKLYTCRLSFLPSGEVIQFGAFRNGCENNK